MNEPAPRSTHPAENTSELLAPLVDAFGSLVSAEVRKQPLPRDPAFVEQVFPLVKAINLYFGTEFRGWEHVPRDTSCLIVGNHSGGAQANDFWFLFYQ